MFKASITVASTRQSMTVRRGWGEGSCGERGRRERIEVNLLFILIILRLLPTIRFSLSNLRDHVTDVSLGSLRDHVTDVSIVV